jgi:radical SAM superfamily enzyme YgiQ (UPF0313 family)
MKVLLISPEFPETFWTLRNAIKFLGVKAGGPPLALLTVAAMMPGEWDKKLVDLNVEPLTKAHLAWADLAFLSAMTVQAPSADEIIQRCRAAGVKVCAGGVHFSTAGTPFEPVDHLFIGEAEETFPVFLADLAHGKALPEYRASRFPDLALTPVPGWDPFLCGKSAILRNIHDTAEIDYRHATFGDEGLFRSAMEDLRPGPQLGPTFEKGSG